MMGCRCLQDDEISQIGEFFDATIGDEVADKHDTWARNKAMFFFALYSGMRISEMLSFTLKDVYQYGKIAQTAYLQKKNTKGKTAGRMIMINNPCKTVLEDYFKHYNLANRSPMTPLFQSRTGNKISVRQVQFIYKIMFDKCGIVDAPHRLSTHSTRKTFAQTVYESSDKDIIATQMALGHKSLQATQSYIMPNIAGLNKVLNDLNFNSNAKENIDDGQ